MPFDSQRDDGLPFTISLRRINRAVGYTAICLPALLLVLTWTTATCFGTTLSHYYFSRIGGDLFVCALGFIGLQLLVFYQFPGGAVAGYMAHTRRDLHLLRLAGLCALIVGFVPTSGTGCAYDGSQVARAFLLEPQEGDGQVIHAAITHDFWTSFALFDNPRDVPAILARLHVGAAGVLLAIMAYFSLCVFRRNNAGPLQAAGNRKTVRNAFYKGLGWAIIGCLIAISIRFIVIDRLLPTDLGAALSTGWDGLRLTLILETLALSAFGLSWLIKGRFIAALDDPDP